MKIRIFIILLSLFISISLVSILSAEAIRGLVTQVSPVYSNYTQKTPYQECYSQQVFVPYEKSFSNSPAIAGGIVGGVIGNQFGKGDGNTILTVAGVLLGSSIGNNMGESNNGYTKNVQRCETRYSDSVNSRIRGYNIVVRIPNGNFINTYRETSSPPHIHSHVNVFVDYRVGN